MVEIGKTRQIAVRAKREGRLVPVLDTDGNPLTRIASSEVVRATREILGGGFGPDSNRKLVVSLKAGDLLSLRPQGTRQQVEIPLRMVYRWVLQYRASARLLEKAREAKARKQEVRIERQRQAADRKVKKEVFA